MSNSSPDGTKIFFYFSGYFEEKNINGLILAQNPLSILNIETGINTPLKQISELQEGDVGKKLPFSAFNENSQPLHMLDVDIGVVGHDKKIHIIKQSWDYSNLINIFKLGMHEYAAKIVQTLSPILSVHDSIHTIDSSLSHLVVVSSEGNITTWPRNGISIKENEFKTVQCTEKFFSFVFNHKENLLCFGLNNGQIFIANMVDLAQNKIISLFPNSSANINWLSSYNDLLLACALDYCKTKTQHCCKKDTAPISPRCAECKAANYDMVYNTQKNINLTTVDQVRYDLQQQLDDLNNQECNHVTMIKNNMPDICDYHRHSVDPFEVEHSLFSAQQLKKMLLNQNKQAPLVLRSFLKKKFLLPGVSQDLGSLINSEILQIKPISENQIVIHIVNTYEQINCEKKNRRHQIYVGEINQSDSYKLLSDSSTCNAMHIIPTAQNNCVILIETSDGNIHAVMEHIIKYTKNSMYDWLKNIYINTLRVFSHRMLPFLLIEFSSILIMMSSFFYIDIAKDCGILRALSLYPLFHLIDFLTKNL
ncbi:MAG TPA: hypothetical protein VLB80_04595 [Candidatus Babeliales bacterium]|nr:hypothetical protein [Candidatus Babeliales bacterium]